MPTLQLSETEPGRRAMQELDKQRFQYKQVLVQRRLHCVYLKASTSLSNELIGVCMQVHANQVGQYIRLYEQGGIAKLSETHYGTNRSSLEDHAELLVNAFIEKPPLTLSQARHRILELTGIERGNSRVEAFLKRHSFVYRKCGYVPGKADPQQQQEWLEKSFKAEREAARKGQSVLLFMDAAHFVLSHFCCMMWCFKRLFLRSGAGAPRWTETVSTC